MDSNKYDVIIIGAGIGGLVCGNYLAKAGKKVLVLEKNSFPGGCCSSFIIDGYFFDTGAHLLNEMGRGGAFKNILKELGVYNKRDYIQLNPLAVFYLGGKKYIFKSGYRENIHYLKSKFPHEDIEGFFSLANKNPIYLYNRLKNNTFQDILDEYFDCSLLKAFIYTFVFPIGTFPERLSAIYGLKFVSSKFKGGYFYPKDGMQSISNRLVNRLYKERNSKIIFNSEVKKILVEDGAAHGVIDSSNKEFYADIIISNISPINTFKKLAKFREEHLNIRKKILSMDFTESALVVHVALKKRMNFFRKRTLYFIISDDNWHDSERNKKLYLSKSPLYKPIGFICMPNSIFQTKRELNQNHSLNLLMIMYYKPRSFWNKYKVQFANTMIKDMEVIFPGFRDNILFKKITTPASIESYTGNNRGAVGGWALTLEQTGPKSFPYRAPIKDLYFTGHWTYPGTGISSAAISGRNVARLILKSLK